MHPHDEDVTGIKKKSHSHDGDDCDCGEECECEHEHLQGEPMHPHHPHHEHSPHHGPKHEVPPHLLKEIMEMKEKIGKLEGMIEVILKKID